MTVAHSATGVAQTAIAESATPLKTPLRAAVRGGVRTTTVVKTTTVVESTTGHPTEPKSLALLPPKPQTSHSEALVTLVASTCLHGRADVAPRLSMRRREGWDLLNHRANLGSTLAMIERGRLPGAVKAGKCGSDAKVWFICRCVVSSARCAAAKSVQGVQILCTPVQLWDRVAKPYSVPVTESVTVTKTGTVTESVTPSVTDRATDGARAKAALCDCAGLPSRRLGAVAGNDCSSTSVDADVDGPVDAGVVELRSKSATLHCFLQGALKDPSGSAQGVLQASHTDLRRLSLTNVLSDGVATRSPVRTASPKGAPKYPFGEGLGEAFPIPFGEPFRNPLMTRYQADIRPMTDAEYSALLDYALGELGGLERQIDKCCAAMRKRAKNASVTRSERLRNVSVTVR